MRSDGRWVALAFVALALVLGVTVWQSSAHLGPAEAAFEGRVHLRHGDDVLGPWLFWDASYYAQIADHGYTAADVEVFESGGGASVAFFPGYPLAVRAVSTLVGDTALALILVTFLSGLALSVVLHGWFAGRLAPDSARLATAATFLFPWAFFLVAAGYSEALFVLSAVGAFALLDDDRPLAAGAVGAIASGTRFVGVALIVGLAVRAAERRGALSFEGWRPRLELSRLQRADAGVLLSASGLGAFMVLSWVRYGQPLAFSTAQTGWNQGAEPRTWFKLRLVDQILHNPDHFFVIRLVVQGAVALIFAAAIPAVWRRFGAGYGTYTALALGLPMIGSAAFASHGRFVLVLFPVFGVLGEWLAGQPRARAWTYLTVSGGLLVAVTSFWARGYWMA